MTSHLKCSKYNIKLVSCTVNFRIIDRNFGIAGVHPKLRDNPEKIWILGRYVIMKGSISGLMTVTFQRILFSDLALLLFLYLLVLGLVLAD